MAGVPETQYAKTSSGVHIAYQTYGEGPFDVVFHGPLVTHIELLWEDDAARRFFESVGRFSRLILMDKRGSGMSDPIERTASIEDRTEDLEAVLEATRCENPVLLGCSEGGQASAVWAAANPRRCRALAVYSSCPFFDHDPDRDPPGPPDAAVEFFLDLVERDWGGPEVLRIILPSVVGDPDRERWWRRLFRQAMSPGGLIAQLQVGREIDISEVLPAVQAPTLVMHARDELFIHVSLGRKFAELVPGAKFIEMPGGDHLPYGENGPAVAAALHEFLTGRTVEVEPERILATVMFTDIVDSTARAAASGDARWRETLDRHDAQMREILTRERGRLVKSTGDGILATFDGPARAIEAARAMIDAARGLGLEIRAGIHTGEIELRGEDVAGLGVHIAQRVSGTAQAGELRVSRTVADLVVGSGLEFEDLGEHDLKGVDGPWKLFRPRPPRPA